MRGHAHQARPRRRVSADARPARVPRASRERRRCRCGGRRGGRRLRQLTERKRLIHGGTRSSLADLDFQARVVEALDGPRGRVRAASRREQRRRAADIAVVRFGEKYKQWNAAFDAGFAAALGKPLIILHQDEHAHALKEVDAAALAVAKTPDQVVAILSYVINGELTGYTEAQDAAQ